MRILQNGGRPGCNKILYHKRFVGQNGYDDVAVVRELSNEEANKLILKCRGETFVYHTSKEKLEMEIVKMPILR